MKKIRKILVPTDFSDGAAEAYPFAQRFSEKFGGKIDFIHVIPTAKYFSESIKKLGVPFDMEEDLFPHIIEEAEHQLENIMDDYVVDANKGEFFVKIDRRPSDTIVEHAKEHGYDMILMGARGKHESDILRGTITEKVIRYSETPVLTVSGDMPGKGLQRILLPTDTSEISYLSLPWAISMAEIFDGEITFFNVIELYGSLSENIPHEPGKSEMLAIYEDIIEEAGDYLADHGYDNMHIERGDEAYEDQLVIQDGSSSQTINLHTKVVKGVSAHYEIEDFARENIDLVVMTTHGRSGLAHMFLGSTTENVAKYVSKPVLTVRPHERHLK